MMKLLIKSALLAILLAGSATASVAWAHGHFHHHGARVGVFIDPWPLFYSGSYYSGSYYSGPYYYPYAYPYRYYPQTVYPEVIVTPPGPTVYIEQGGTVANPTSQAGDGQNDWYYCNKPDGYYPYVKSCPGGWQRVPSHPPSQP